MLEGLLSTVIHDQPVICTEQEFARIVPSTGETCEQWLGPYVQEMGGYLQNPTNTTLCLYCRFANGDQYVRFRFPFLDPDCRAHLLTYTTRIIGETMVYLCNAQSFTVSNVQRLHSF